MGTIIEIIKELHKTLRRRADNILLNDIMSETIQGLIADMKETLKNTPDGVGLAAPQVGQSLRIFIVSEEAEEIDRVERKRERSGIPGDETKAGYEKREWRYYVFINPRVLGISRRKLDGVEGCLSVPGVFGPIDRPEKITIEAFDEEGKKFMRGYSRFFARVVQHELDHLDGVLFIDKARHLSKSQK